VLVAAKFEVIIVVIVVGIVDVKIKTGE